MNLEFAHLTLGPLQNNVYLLGDHDSGDAVVIDPSFEIEGVLEHAEQLGWTIRQIWLTHAHFDHIAGAGLLTSSSSSPISVGLHSGDMDWYQDGGGAGKFGLSISQPPPVSIPFENGMPLKITEDQPVVVRVLFAPGHSPGHVMFYCERLSVLFCGDVIFREGVGRTDLEGGDWTTLITSIRDQVLTLPDETRLLPGHGPETTVKHEREHNPFLNAIR